MYYVDTHCHLFREYYDDIDEVVKRAKDNKVGMIIVYGCNRKSNEEVLELVSKYDIVYGALGWQPEEIDDICDEDFNWLEKHINDDKIVAIGEIGLDYHYKDTNKEKQIEVFKRQLEVAKKYNKPVIVHSRDASMDTYNILKESKTRGVLHCYSGSCEMAMEYIKIGFYLGIGGISTFKNAKNIIEVIKKVPLSYIVVETDSPYLTPVPYRGERNEPAYISLVYDKIAEIKEIEVSEVIVVTTGTVLSIFDKC